MKRFLLPGIVVAMALPNGFCAAQAPYRGSQDRSRQAAVQPPFTLNAQEQKAVDDVLNYWEQRSKSIQRYRCQFQRWEYDPVFGPPGTFKTFSRGEINYEAPDKGMFKVTEMWDYKASTTPREEPKYVKRDGESAEHWICDGNNIWEHDPKAKRLIQRELPPHLRGKAISDGPLPFLFGADAQKIKDRYWIRRKPVPEGAKEYLLEAIPKTRKDAANFSMVHVVIAQEDFLPKGLIIFDRNLDPRQKPARTTFTFDKRETNWNILLDQLQPWKSKFYEPKVPFGWKKVVEKYETPPGSQDFAPASSGGVSEARRGQSGRSPR